MDSNAHRTFSSLCCFLASLLAGTPSLADEPATDEPASDETTPAEGDEPAAEPAPAEADEAAAETPPAEAEEPAVAEPDPGAAQANVGSHGGLIRLPGGTEAGLLPGSARDGVGWHLVRLESAEALLPNPEGVGPRPIDRRSGTPLGMVEGPPLALGAGFRLRLLEPDPFSESHESSSYEK